MNAPGNLQQFYLRYLLDNLPPEERERIDDALITDQEFSDSFQEARYDLIDAYVANQLPMEVRRQVEQGILSMKDSQNGLPSAIALNESGTASRADAASLGDFSKDAKPAVQQMSSRTFRIRFFASVLAACFFLAVVWIYVQRRNLPAMRSSLPAAPLVSKPQLAASGKSGSVAPAMPGAIVPSLPFHLKSRQTGVVALAMPVETARGSGQVPLHLRPGSDRLPVQWIRVQWPLPSDATAPNYTVEVSSDGSRVATLAQHGPLMTVGTIRVATFLLRADKLTNAEYNFRLYAGGASGNAPVAESSVLVSH